VTLVYLDTTTSAQLVNVLTYAMLGASFLMAGHKSLVPAIYTYGAQTIFLGLIALVTAAATGRIELWIVAGITLLLRGVGVTWLLLATMKRIAVKRETNPRIGVLASLLAILTLTGFAFAGTQGLRVIPNVFTPDALPVSLAIVAAGIFTMGSRKKAMTQALGLLMAENGVFLTALTLTFGMPLLIELGIFFDVLTVSVVLGVFAFRASTAYSTLESGGPRRLTD
jgi:hydrogenase-4 component E